MGVFWFCLRIQSLHIDRILHNDLHSRNIIPQNYKYVKNIGFGKATLIDNPVV